MKLTEEQILKIANEMRKSADKLIVSYKLDPHITDKDIRAEFLIIMQKCGVS